MGKTLYTITKHKRDSSTAELLIKDEFTYTDQDRLLTQTHQINSLPKQLIVSNTYDELGKLTSKKVGGTDVTGSIGLQKVDYAYNIRGWLTDINNTEKLSLGIDPDDLFAFKINYNTPAEAAALFNGNISETYWRTKSDYQLRKYNYSYDHLNRLLSANYVKPDTGPAQILGSFDEQLGYDKNGNIRYLLRTGNFDDRSVNLIIDNLDYSYNPKSPNQLLAVEDGTNEPAGFKDNAHQQVEYSYDANGNLIADKNKNIVSIKYNHLNLPTEIIFENGGKINYLYNAVGQKVSKIVLDVAVGSTTSTDYLSGFQYQDDVLKMIPTSEGYVSCVGRTNRRTFMYVFNYTDHLGNIRLSYSQDPISNVLKIMEENHYYPFGLKHSGYNQTELEYSEGLEAIGVHLVQSGGNIIGSPVQDQFTVFNYNYKYNGKEFQDELGLNVIAMDFRQYDPAIGRFSVMDPLSELTPTHNPYRFGFNNPVYWSDPSGLFETRKEAREYRKEHGITGGISKQKDGSYAINDRKNGVSYSKGDDSQGYEKFANDGVQESVIVQAPAKKESSSGGTGFGWMTIWGTDRNGDTSGWKGTTTHSLESSDFIAPQSSRSLNNKSTGIWEWVLSLFKNSTDTYTQGITIQEAVKKNGNTATIEVQNTEPVVTSSVKVVTYTFHLNDSTVTKITNTVDFKGKASDVKKQVDSTNNRNNVINADKSAWLSSWGK